ncbi:hypothetical protein K7432_005246 [Basidiobolus ranarum]|uniref:DDHD domain-containing protein n=1 Tax=Basidiobolus ranarum TaxID=34480 RepID=A0ABR2W3C5_9FUNG
MSPAFLSTNQTDATHVLFVVHGIGPTLGEENAFMENVTGFRKSLKKVLKHEKELQTVEAELIPIEWHNSLHKRIGSNMDNITPPYCPPNIKNFQHEYMADILYYFTQDRGQHILDTIVKSMNEEYDKYMESHPNFKGTFSLVGYSLGGICCYDILCAQEDGANLEGRAKINIKPQKLKFKPHFLFSMGSPIAAVMVMRNQTFEQYKIPDYCIHHNIYHPFDPMAYRMEPMVDPKYRELSPMTLPVFSSPRFNLNHRLGFGPFRYPRVKPHALPLPHLGFATLIASLLSKVGGQSKDFTDIPSNIDNQLVPEDRASSTDSNISVSDNEEILELPRSDSPEPLEIITDLSTSMPSNDIPEAITPEDEPLCHPPLKYRMDHALQEKLRIDNVAHRYMITLRAHFSYWEHRDVAHHILKSLHDNLDNEPFLLINV